MSETKDTTARAPRAKRTRRTPEELKTQRRIAEIVASEDIAEQDEGDMTCRLSEMMMQLVGLRTPASAELAAEVYRACCRAWDKNRGLYGELNMTDSRERETVEYHGELLAAIERAEAGEWPELLQEGGK